MLAPMAVLFVSPEERADIKITVRDVQPGWKVDGKMEAVSQSFVAALMAGTRDSMHWTYNTK